MEKKVFTDEEEERMGILWVLLNCTTEYKGDSAKICEVMEAIEKSCPAARRMWSGNFKLVVGDKVIYEWHAG